MLPRLDVVLPRHDKNPPAEPHDVDFRSIQTRQHGAGDHIIDGAERCMTGAQIKHAIQRTDQRIELMRTEKNGNP